MPPVTSSLIAVSHHQGDIAVLVVKVEGSDVLRKKVSVLDLQKTKIQKDYFPSVIIGIIVRSKTIYIAKNVFIYCSDI
jgi:hypothetical protein